MEDAFLLSMDVLNTINPKTASSAIIRPPSNRELVSPNYKSNPSIIAKYKISMDVLSVIMDLEMEIKEIANLNSKGVCYTNPMATAGPARLHTMPSRMEHVLLLDASIKNKEHVRLVMAQLDSNSAMVSASSITAFTLLVRAVSPVLMDWWLAVGGVVSLLVRSV